MKSTGFVFGLALALLGSACATTSYSLVADAPPPTPQEEDVVFEEQEGNVWIEGHYARSGKQWTWIPGYYVAERRDEVFRQGYWDQRDGRWHYIEGRWVPAREGYVRVRGHWERDGAALVWRQGYWSPVREDATWEAGHWQNHGRSKLWRIGRWKLNGADEAGQERVRTEVEAETKAKRASRARKGKAAKTIAREGRTQVSARGQDR